MKLRPLGCVHRTIPSQNVTFAPPSAPPWGCRLAPPSHTFAAPWPCRPLIVIAFMAYVLYKILTTDPTPLIVAIVSILVGVIWYAVFVRPKKGERWTLPEPQADES